MSRPPKYSTEQILDASLTMVLDGGPMKLSVAGVAQQIGAPSGSIYHRFSGKDALVGALWLRSVEKFQEGFTTAIAADEPLEAAIAAATHVVRWSRNEFDHARLLLVHRSRDFFGAGWPEELRDRNDRQRLKAQRAIRDLADRLGAVDADGLARVKFAVVSVPYGAVRPALSTGRRPPSILEVFVEETVVALLGPLAGRRKDT
ncbi:MAG: TetR/AcrR family transcriptional regulator [Acidobacteria bacterium]|nr:TetR/AcrR family transcriptional regulator [Acidobacteriota bacterium]